MERPPTLAPLAAPGGLISRSGRPIPTDGDPAQLHRPQPGGAPPDDDADRRRHGARRVRVRDRADALGRPAKDAGRHRPGRQRRRDSPQLADRSAKRLRASAGGNRRKPAADCARRRRSAAGLQGGGRADQPAEARDGQGGQRRDPRRDAGRADAAAASSARRRPDVSTGNGRGDRGARDRGRIPGRGPRRDAALRVARLDGRRRFRRRPHRVRFRDLGRCRADAAGVSPHRLFVDAVQAERSERVRRRRRRRSKTTRG